MTVEESSPSEVYTALARMALTRGMSASSIQQLSQIGQCKSYPAGRLIFNESEYHDRLHILCSGMVTLGMRVPNHGVEMILTLGDGEFLAWSALLADGIMTTSAVVTKDTTAIEFSTHDLKVLCEQNYELGYHVMHQVAISLSRRLLATRLQLLDLFRDSAR
jgi:CRP-like cAMP-binding protein